MAIIWQKTINDTHYEVKAAGNSRRLYSDGVFHSQYNPARPITGTLWDLLMLPAFFYTPGRMPKCGARRDAQEPPPGTVNRVLVLGLGGGTVVHQLLHFVRPEHIVCVELDPVHIIIAQRFFGITQKNAEIYEADAKLWIENYQGPRFDMIIDDLFGERHGQPVRAIDANAGWFRSLTQHLAPAGAIVINFVSRHEMRQSGYFSNMAVARRFKSAFQLTDPVCDNAIGVFLRRQATSRMLRERLKVTPELNTALKNGKLRYRIRRM